MWRNFKGDLSIESNSIGFSEQQENILSDVLSEKQSVAINKVDITEQGDEKTKNKKDEVQTKLVENSKLLIPETKGEAQLSTAVSIFDINAKIARQAPELPSIDGIEYPRAASWASESLNNVLKDEKGRQLFHVFLHDSLAEENLSFIESFEKFKQMTSPAEKKQYVQEFFEKYSPYVNLSSVALQKIKETAEKDDPDPDAFLLAVKK
ncbi:hypothetical protein DINM_007095 [Dirofilaria immitis]|nr:hypothetical protein [Dirofilaria immitis]